MFVLFSSVPTIPSGNIHAPTVMVAEKGADLVKELWLQEDVVRSEQAAAEASAAAAEAAVVVAASTRVNVVANVTQG